MDFKQYLAHHAKIINLRLAKIFLRWEKEIDKDNKELLALYRSFARCVHGGKMVRGTLTVLGYELANIHPPAAIYDCAAACEILHTSLLVHDDIIDNSPLRRGRPALHKQFGGGQYAASQTLCLGDMGIFMAYHTISASRIREDRKVRALEAFSGHNLQTAWGQILDIAYSSKRHYKEKTAISIYTLKTAKYTIVSPLSIGALVAGAESRLLKKVKTFGENLGIAFQIHDDILGVFGDEAVTGKSTTSDIQEGKASLLVAYAMKRASGADKKFLAEYYGRSDIDKNTLKKIRDIFIHSGALDATKNHAKRYINLAKNAIPSLTKDKKRQKLLHEFADFVITRGK